MEIIITAKTIEEALQKAVTELGAKSTDELKYEILEQPKKGFLGLGGTPAKIKADYTKEETCVTCGNCRGLGFIKTVVADMGLDAVVEMTENASGDMLINISGGNSGVLIGHHGDTLDSLQYLTNLAANRKDDGEKREYAKITVDVEGYRAKREETLRALARRKAEQVLKYKKSIMLEPMNPYERRIIHSEIQNIEGVSTNSIGSDNNRKIVVYLEGNEETAEPPRSRGGRRRRPAATSGTDSDVTDTKRTYTDDADNGDTDESIK